MHGNTCYHQFVIRNYDFHSIDNYPQNSDLKSQNQQQQQFSFEDFTLIACILQDFSFHDSCFQPQQILVIRSRKLFGRKSQMRFWGRRWISVIAESYKSEKILGDYVSIPRDLHQFRPFHNSAFTERQYYPLVFII